MLVLAGSIAAAALLLSHYEFMLGSVVGSMIAVLNFHWLKQAVFALSGASAAAQPNRSSGGIVLRFVLRYVLIGVVAYVIFKRLTHGLYGFFTGLLVPVGAILVEAVYEIYAEFRGKRFPTQ
jgi:hypothetical protein